MKGWAEATVAKDTRVAEEAARARTAMATDARVAAEAGKVWATTRAMGCCPTTNQSLPRNFLQVPAHHHLPEKSTIEWRIARKKI